MCTLNRLKIREARLQLSQIEQSVPAAQPGVQATEWLLKMSRIPLFARKILNI